MDHKLILEFADDWEEHEDECSENHDQGGAKGEEKDSGQLTIKGPMDMLYPLMLDYCFMRTNQVQTLKQYVIPFRDYVI